MFCASFMDHRPVRGNEFPRFRISHFWAHIAETGRLDPGGLIPLIWIEVPAFGQEGDVGWCWRTLKAYGFKEVLSVTMRVNIGLLVPLMAQYSAPIWATLVAGFFMLLALSLSMYLIFEHLSAYNNPEVSSFYFCSPIIIFLHNSVYQNHGKA